MYMYTLQVFSKMDTSNLFDWDLLKLTFVTKMEKYESNTYGYVFIKFNYWLFFEACLEILYNKFSYKKFS